MKADFPHSIGLAIAKSIRRELSPACERIEIVGSVRRQRPRVGDVELLAVPQRGGLFGDSEDFDQSPLAEVLARLQATNRLRYLEGQNRQRKYLVVQHDPLVLELYLTRPENWGYQCVIRTGPAAFSKACVTHRNRGGLLDDHRVIHDGRVYRSPPAVTGFIDFRGPRGGRTGERFFDPGGQPPLDTPEEADFLAECGLDWIEPQNRARYVPTYTPKPTVIDSEAVAREADS